MIKFKVRLSKKDIKSFLIYKMQLFHPKNLLALAIYFVPFIIILMLLLLQTIPLSIGLILLAMLTAIFGYTTLRIYKAYKNAVLVNQKLIGKERQFLLNRYSLQINCEDAQLNSQYPLDALLRMEEEKQNWILVFSPNENILIPKHALDEKQQNIFFEKIDQALAKNG